VTLDREGWVKDVRSADLFFDDERVLVCSLTSSEVDFPTSGHMGEQHHVVDRPVADRELVALVRSCWTNEPRSSLDAAARDATWDPVRETFGRDRYDEVNYISLGRHVRKRPGYSWEAVTVGATRWVAGNRESVEKDGRSELPLDASDDELAAAIRAAMAATSGPETA